MQSGVGAFTQVKQHAVQESRRADLVGDVAQHFSTHVLPVGGDGLNGALWP